MRASVDTPGLAKTPILVAYMTTPFVRKKTRLLAISLLPGGKHLQF